MKISTNPNAVTLLNEYCKKRRIYKSALARKMNLSYKALLNALKAKTVEVDRLIEFCHAFQYNFLMDLAHQLPSTYASDEANSNHKDEEIARLKEQLKILEVEKNLLEKMMIR